MSEPSAARRWLVLLFRLVGTAGGLGGLLALLRGLPEVITPLWVWVAVLFLLLVAVLCASAVAVLRACWPSQSAHRKELLQALLRRHTAP